MVKFENKYGFNFYMGDQWRDLTEQERIRFGIPDSYLNYAVNPTEGFEFMVVFDGFGNNPDDLDNFFNLCKKNMLANGFIILAEEEYVGISRTPLTPIKAIKTFCQKPDGTKQTSYFLRLGGKTEQGYAYGCITINSNENHDINESKIVTALTNWEYVNIE